MKSDRLFRPACVLALAGALSACAPVFLGGVVVGTSVVATDRRSSGAQLEDETIEVRAASRIQEHVGQRVHVDVTSYNRQVLLTGEVGSLQDKQLIEQIVARVDNVRAVINELEVMGNSATMQRSSDALITGRVKTNLLDARDLTANAFKVVTERGTTYLLGRVTRREADRATEVTRNTPGVQKVVRVLEIISEEELQGAQPLKPAANTGMATR